MGGKFSYNGHEVPLEFLSLFPESQTVDIHELFIAEEEGKRLACRDELTGVFNLRGFNSAAQDVLSTLRRADFSTDKSNNLKRRTDGAFFIFVDLDGFKNINDTIGHHTGDEVLKDIATLIKGRMRDNDVLGRIGGDEFAILLQVKNENDANHVVISLQELLDKNFIGDEHQQIRATATLGMAKVDISSMDSLQNAKKRADADMYCNKQKRYPNRTPR